MTDEVAKEYGEGARITEYVSTGPKSYAYAVTTADGEKRGDVKSKGTVHKLCHKCVTQLWDAIAQVL